MKKPSFFNSFSGFSIFDKKRDKISFPLCIEAVRRERPLLSKIVNEFGDLNMLDFSTRIFEKGILQHNIYRSEFIDLLRLAFPTTSLEVIRQLDISLRKNPVVSTADHHSIINCSVYLNSNILLSIFAKNFSQNKDPIIAPPIFSTSAIPLSNAVYPRGILLANPNGIKRFAFFGGKQRQEAVLLVDRLSFSKSQINKWVDKNKNIFTRKELEFISKILLDLAINSDINNGKNFVEQTQMFNDWLWAKIFPGVKLFFFPLETLTKTFFCEILAKNKSGPFYNFFFNFPLQRQDKLFNGIYGAWTLSKLNDFLPGGGTCFFWGVTKEKRTIPLKRINGFLTSKEENFEPIKWNIDDLVQALSERKIVPSVLTTLLIMVHYGLYCSGGFNQVAYFTPMVVQYKKALLEMSEEKEAQRLEKILTDGAHAFLYFLFGESKDEMIPLCSFNLLQQKIRANSILEILRKTTLKEVFETTAPLIFPIVTDSVTQDRINFSFQEVYRQLKTKVPKNLVVQNW